MRDHIMDEPLVTLKIAEDVFEKIVEVATLEVKGVLKISTRKPTIKESLFSINMDIKEIDIDFRDALQIRISVIIDANARAVSVSKKIQKHVKEAVQSMTGVPVSSVEVIVSNLAFVNSDEISSQNYFETNKKDDLHLEDFEAKNYKK